MMKLHLTNQANIPMALSNEFNPQITWELEDCTTKAARLACINKHAKYGHKYELEYSSKTKEVYKHVDSLGNIDYLIVRFN